MRQASFEWDVEKDLENQAKHGVSFAQAQYAFTDPRRVIAEDLSHRQTEQRYDGFGAVEGGILTVRLTYRRGIIRIFGAGYWRKGRQSMHAKITYTNEPLGDLQVIPDFLPAPEELVFQDDTVKITITLSRSSVEFFKREAKKHHTQYQKMIRRLLDVYTQKHHDRSGR